jgi:hypothetical protein
LLAEVESDDNKRLTNGITDLDAEGKEEDDSNGVKTDTKEQISNDPSVVQSSYNQDELRDKVDDYTDERENQVGDEKPNGVVERHAGVSVECRDCDKEADSKDGQTGESE